jgi:hypothetical protein
VAAVVLAKLGLTQLWRFRVVAVMVLVLPLRVPLSPEVAVVVEQGLAQQTALALAVMVVELVVYGHHQPELMPFRIMVMLTLAVVRGLLKLATLEQRLHPVMAVPVLLFLKCP